MRTIFKLLLVMVLVPMILLTFQASAHAQKAVYPQRPVTAIVPFPPGSSLDMTGRIVAETAKNYFPQPISIVNKPGGGATIGSTEVVKAATDGYTIGVLYVSTFSVTSQVTPGLAIKGPGDITPVIGLQFAANTLLDRPDRPWKTLKEMIDYARANPGKVRIGTMGLNTGAHFDIAQLVKAAKVDINIVPFEGGAPADTALLGGHIDGIIANPGPRMEHVKAGNWRNLALFYKERLPEIPNVPTVSELGYKIYDIGVYAFVGVPNGTPKEVVRTLYEAFQKARESGSFKKFCSDNFFVLMHQDGDEVKRFMENEYTHITELIK
jgi:tripartite-type tricarboxylate transporter receptor subunit TctC